MKGWALLLGKFLRPRWEETMIMVQLAALTSPPLACAREWLEVLKTVEHPLVEPLPDSGKIVGKSFATVNHQTHGSAVY